MELPWPAQFGVCGMFAFLLYRQSVDNREATKDAAKEHKEGLNNLAAQIGGLRTDLKENMDSQLEELRKK